MNDMNQDGEHIDAEVRAPLVDRKALTINGIKVGIANNCGAVVR